MRTFYNCNSLTIYCETSFEPRDWFNAMGNGVDLSWNCNHRPVYWRVTQEYIIYQDGLQYLIKNGEAVVTGHEVSITNVIIPETIDVKGATYSVTSIGSWAFKDYDFLISIVIPNSVTSIEGRAFQGCSSLIIYCETNSQPSGWDSYWNFDDRPVYWSGQWSYVNGAPTPNN